MKLFFVLLVLTFTTSVLADEYVHGYSKRDGTYVEPYYRSSPNNTTSDNWSTKGNVNPYTGQEGTRSNEYQYNPPPAYAPQQPYQYNNPYNNR